jgi:hypothetical protein
MSVPRDPDRPAGDERAVSNVLGYIIVLTIIIASVVAIVALGSAALVDTQQQSELQRAEHSMTLFDSRAAMVALGTSDTQALNFGHDSGSFQADPDAGWLAIHHVDYTAGETEEVFNESLGALVYTNDDTRMAYQGGGVWRLDDQGAAQMLSPPEFHYRQATLTLPVIRIGGSQTSARSPTTTVKSTGDARLVFPNQTTGTANGTGAPYDYNGAGEPYYNPVGNGTVQVTIHSDYYQGWGTYFRERTTAQVEEFDSNSTVRITLISLAGSLGRFPMPNEDEGVEVSGMGAGHPVTDFRLNLSEGQTGGGENHWAMYSTEGYNEFEVHVEPDFGACEARISVYYHNSSSGVREEWQTDVLDETTSSAVSCTNDYIEVDLTDDAESIEYSEIDGTTGSGTKFCFGPDIKDFSTDNPAVLDQHSTVDPGSISPGHTETLNFTVNHYLSRLGTSYTLTVKDAQGNFCPSGAGGGKGKGKGGGSDSVDEGASFGVLDFQETSAARFITYLHVTENEIEIDFD